jgi:hypothetical protein
MSFNLEMREMISVLLELWLTVSQGDSMDVQLGFTALTVNRPHCRGWRGGGHQFVMRPLLRSSERQGEF